MIAAYERVSEFDVVHDHTLVGPLYAARFPDLAVVTTNHGPFLSDLGCLYQAVSSQVPVIAISFGTGSTLARLKMVRAMTVPSRPVDREDPGHGVRHFCVGPTEHNTNRFVPVTGPRIGLGLAAGP